ncbi:MAG: DegT/DnrJ/EryC1/StrS aminotransferase family protein [Candidatus Omnitrophota bacterium]|jgi:dTDP-4-amino-4,6-dideoxygalactose transaminase
MNLFHEIPPTAGLPLYTKDFFSAIFRKGGSLEEDFKNYFGAPFAAVTYSGTAAFYIILEALKSLSSKKTILIPSYVCPLIPLAIKRAGLKVLVCDINKDSFDFQNNQLETLCTDNSDILAIVAVHLAGLPVNFQAIERMAKGKKIFIIEDCAQSLGATYQGEKTGKLGDFAFYSLCRGKGITIYEGGAITTNLKFIPAINNAIECVAKNKFLSETLKILELLGYFAFYRPQLFWFIFRLPQVFWQAQGKIEKAFIEYFDCNFPVHKVSGLRKNIGHAMFPRLEEEIIKQRQVVSAYIAGLKDAPGIKLITEQQGNRSNYPYLTLLFDDEDRRRRAFNTLIGSGLGISQIYLSAITDYGYLKDIVGNETCPNARSIAKSHITLTTSTFLSKKEIFCVIEKVRKI